MALPSLVAFVDPAHALYAATFRACRPGVKFVNDAYEEFPLDPSVRREIDRGNAERLPRAAR
jgi:hypothetical protein